MVGVALVTKCVYGNLSKRLKQGCISHSFTVDGVLNVIYLWFKYYFLALQVVNLQGGCTNLKLVAPGCF